MRVERSKCASCSVPLTGGQKKFCSKKCGQRDWYLQRGKSQRSMPRTHSGAPIWLVCAKCGRPIDVPKAIKKYCSKKCKRASARDRSKPERAVRQRGRPALPRGRCQNCKASLAGQQTKYCGFDCSVRARQSVIIIAGEAFTLREVALATGADQRRIKRAAANGLDVTALPLDTRRGRPAKHFSHVGLAKTVAELALQKGISASAMRRRIKKLGVEKALTIDRQVKPSCPSDGDELRPSR